MELLKQLPNPMGLEKKDLLGLLLREEYGYLPARPYEVTAEETAFDRKFCAGKAPLRTLKLTGRAEWGEFSFPVYYVAPKDKTGIPAFVHINFRDAIPDRYQPTEELVDAGFATLTFCYKDVSSDDGDFTNGLAGVVYPNGKRKRDDCGKIGLWAWAAMAVMDYAMTLPELDHGRISVVGHSRLGKTALLTGALDERFYCAFSNDSGCSGASLARKNEGETVAKIVKTFPYWFCENYYKYADAEDTLPFDQHWLLAANLPHKVYVASAAGDLWACPKNEYLSCIAASDYYKAHGKSGFVHPDRLPEVGDRFHEGDIGYHLRDGLHYLGREDWKNYIRYLNFIE
ncbi:MAG: hypothetical protein IJX28_02725 [Clostridia bacterium]|nr:hypothetical protein [Clostridia bacterium]